MDGRIMKLRRRLNQELARQLVEAGLDTPRKIKAAEDEELGSVVGEEALSEVRATFPKT